MGATIVRGGNVLAVGQSRLNCNPGWCDFDQPGIRERVSLHAEESALRRCGNARRASVYVARIGRNGRIGLAKPCKRCRKLLIEAGVRRVIYTVDPTTYSVWTPYDD